MLESGKERLSYDACRECMKDRVVKKRGYIDDKEFGEYFIYIWEQEKVICPGRKVQSVYKNPPENCKYELEHLIGSQRRTVK